MHAGALLLIECWSSHVFVCFYIARICERTTFGNSKQKWVNRTARRTETIGINLHAQRHTREEGRYLFALLRCTARSYFSSEYWSRNKKEMLSVYASPAKLQHPRRQPSSKMKTMTKIVKRCKKQRFLFYMRAEKVQMGKLSALQDTITFKSQ